MKKRTRNKLIAMLFVTLLVILAGCTVKQDMKNKIKKHLDEKYGVSFSVEKIIEKDSGFNRYFATERGNSSRIFSGNFISATGEISDGYIDALVADKIGLEMTKNLQESIPGIVVLAMPDSYRYYDDGRSDVDISIEDWIIANAEDSFNHGKRRMASSIKLIYLVDENSIDKINFDKYQEYIVGLMDSGFNTLPVFEVDLVYAYSSEEMKQEYLSKYYIGYFEGSDFGKVSRKYFESEHRQSIGVKVNDLLGFTFRNADYGVVPVYEFKFLK